jgi:uncharacterized membrane protein YhhN
MKKQTKLAFAIFLIVSIIDIFAILNQQFFIRNFSKPLILLSLMALYYFSVKKVNKWYLTGLFFSFLGDVFLLGNGKIYFMLGLIAFLLSHIMYIKITTNFIKTKSVSKITLATLPFLVFVIILLSVLKSHLGELLIPVIIYGIVISIFGIVATLNYITYKTKANLWLFFGALFFITSDTILAINKFYDPKEIFGFLIMLTYIIAQFLICKAMISRSKTI